MGAISVRYPALRSACIARWCAALCLVFGSVSGVRAGGLDKAVWFPDPPDVKRFVWAGKPCEGCKPLAPRAEWKTMAALAGLGEISFLLDPGESNSPAWSYAPDTVVLSPSVLKLPDCQLAFVVGHELVHIAQRHFDEDAQELLVLSGKPANWTRTGETAMSLLDGNFSLVLHMSYNWQQQEQEADWVGSLLAAQACGCNLEKGALSYFGDDSQYGGGLAAAHGTNARRISFLKAFTDSAKILARRRY
jgi:Zn-dependent protease with chaperone function